MKSPERVEIRFIFRLPRFDQLKFVQIVHTELYATTAAIVNTQLSNSPSLAGLLCCKSEQSKGLCQAENLDLGVVDNVSARPYNSFKSFT